MVEIDPREHTIEQLMEIYACSRSEAEFIKYHAEPDVFVADADGHQLPG